MAPKPVVFKPSLAKPKPPAILKPANPNPREATCLAAYPAALPTALVLLNPLPESKPNHAPSGPNILAPIAVFTPVAITPADAALRHAS